MLYILLIGQLISQSLSNQAIYSVYNILLLDEKEYKKLVKLREETGLSLSKIIELKLKDYEIIKRENKETFKYRRRL